MADGDINLAALWVPVMAETSQVKGQLAKAGAEGAAAFTAAFKSAADLSGAFGGGRSLDVLATRWKALTGAITGSADGASRAMQVFNTAGVAAVAGFGAALVETTKKAGDFQASQVRLVASAGETAKGMQAVSDGILQLAGQVGYSAGDLSNAMYTVEKAGYRGADGVNVLKAAAQGAKSENADLKEVLGGLTTSMSDFGFGQEKAADVMSKMVAAVGMAKTNFQDFSGALHSVEPFASAVGASLSDVYGSLAQITQSGTGAAQAAQNMARAYSTLSNPSAKMRDEMGQLGLNANDVKEKLGQRGLAGTLQLIANTIREHMNPQQQVMIDTFYKSEQATAAANKMFDAMPPAVKSVAEAIKAGTLSYKDFRKTRGGLDVEQANELQQWVGLNNKVTGYSTALKTGQGDIQTFMQALALATGNQETARIAMQLTGTATDATNEKIRQIDQTTREHDGTVKGFNETQSTLNAKMADAKAAFGAAAIEIGTVFVPVMTQVANVAKTVGDAMAKHPAILKDVTLAVGALGAAWVGLKTINLVESVLNPATKAMGELGAAEEAAATKGDLLRGALGKLAKGGLAFAGADMAGDAAQSAAGPSGFLHGAAVVGTDVAKGAVVGGTIGSVVPIVGTGLGAVVGGGIAGGVGLFNQLTHADGGAIDGSGPKGKDSVPAWLAPGEHVLTADEVDALGGQSAVYAFRKAIRRVDGGEVGPDVQAAMSMSGTPYNQHTRTDCSGMVGRVVEAATGMGGGLPSTQNMGQWLAARGFVSGIGGPGTISVGWYNHGNAPNDGHAAMTLSDGENAEAGGSHGNFLIGGGVGASSSQFDHHMYLPNLYGEGVGGSGGGGAMGAMGGMGGGAFGGGGVGGRGGGGGGFYTPNPEKVTAAQGRVTDLDNQIHVLEERKSELKSDAKQSERDKLDAELQKAHRERDEAQGKLNDAQRGDFHAGTGGSGGRGGQGSTESQAQQFASGALTGLMSDLGFGNVLGGKSPLDWGIVKMATGLASMGIGMANAWTDSKMAGGAPGAGGLAAGLGSGMSALGGAPTGSGLSDVPSGLGGTPDSAPNGGSGGGGGQGIGSALAANMPSIVKMGAAAAGLEPHGQPLAPQGGLKPPDVSGWTRTAPGAGQMPTLGAPPGAGYTPLPSAGAQILPGFKPDAGTPWIPGMTAKYAGGGPVPPSPFGFQPGMDKGALFQAEGPDNYASAYLHNRSFAKPSGTNYTTGLTADQEQKFRDWVKTNNVPTDPNAKIQDYDMRGYWRAMTSGSAEKWAGPGTHFPDTFKTPYDTTFSNESMYATKDNPFVWRGDNLIDGRSGQLVFGHFATGGPSGTDTVPAWLSPGEFVMKTAAVNKYGANFMASVNAGKFATGGVVPLSPSSVSSVPTANSGTSMSVNHHAPVTYDNRIIVQGNHLADADQLVGPMQERMNATTYSRASFGGLPYAVGPGGG